MILFLDFDGVLHPNSRPAGLFMWVPRVSSWLAHWPGVDVVISSSWRTYFRQRELVAMIGAIGDRVVGCTPVYESRQAREVVYPADTKATVLYERQDEIRQWMAASWEPGRYWVALDDMSFLFEPDCERLVLSDGIGGVSPENLQQLSKHAVKAGLMPAWEGP